MGIGGSILLVAIGAVLRYAVTFSTEGIDLHAVGGILMLVGVIGCLLSLAFWSSWGGFGSTRRDVYVDEGPSIEPPVRKRTRRTVVREED